MKNGIILFFFAILLFSCTNDPLKDWETVDLNPYDVHVSILAPDSAIVVADDIGVLKDVTIIKGPDYSVQLFMSKSTNPDVAAIKKEQLEEVKSNRLYSKMMEENEDGFIYENKIDKNTTSYGFRYFFQKEDNDYVFQQALSGIFSLDEIKNMYRAVKQ